MIAEMVAPMMTKRGLEGTRFSRIEPEFNTSLDGIGWYIHMPFCRRLCTYCSFRSLAYSPVKIRPYTEALKKEILTYRNKLGRIKCGDVYFGGGTPSLTWREVIEVADYLREEFEIKGEMGMEANPEDIKEEICTPLKQAGITKISMGMQSFDTKTLERMQRHYDARQVLTAIELLLNMGFTVSIDLLYGLPGQHVSGLLHDLKIAAGAGVHHISAYPPDAFPVYQVDENIGAGLSAYTKIGGLFYVNTFFLREYIKHVEEGLPIATGMTMPPKRVMRRWFMMGLYRSGVEKVEFEKRFGVTLEQVLGKFLFMLRLLNIIREHPDRIQVTRKGMYWASLMTKASMINFPGRYYQECLHHPWPSDFEM